jgi:hypothetical protein
MSSRNVPYGFDVRDQEWCQSAQVCRRESAAPVWFGHNALDHERVDVHQADLEQMKAQHRNLLIVNSVAGNLAATCKVDKRIRTVPVLYHLQAFVNLRSQRWDSEIPAQEGLYRRDSAAMSGCRVGEGRTDSRGRCARRVRLVALQSVARR